MSGRRWKADRSFPTSGLMSHEKNVITTVGTCDLAAFSLTLSTSNESSSTRCDVLVRFLSQEMFACGVSHGHSAKHCSSRFDLATHYAPYCPHVSCTPHPRRTWKSQVMPYVMMFIASNMGGSLGTWVHVSWGKSIVFSRKCVNTLGFSLATVSLLLMPRATHWKDGLLYTTMALSALGFSRGGWAVNHMDIAPRHAGVVMAIANGAGTLAGIVGVSWTGKVLEAMGGSTEPLAWSIALGAVALVCASALVVFLVLARGETLFH